MLNDNAPETFAEQYAPRKDASQRAARAARQRLDRDAPDAPIVRPRLDPRIVGGIGLLAVAGVCALALSQFSSSGPLVIPPATVSAHTFGLPPVTSPAARTAPPTAETLPGHTILAYAAPDGLLLGSVPADQQIVPVAHYGTGWIAYQDGAGLVWVRARDLPGVALAGPDLAPAQTGRGLGIVEVWTPPEAPAETETKAAPDRTKARATAITRLNLPPPAR